MIPRAAFWLSFALMLGGMAAMLFVSAPRIDAGGLAPFDTRATGYSYDEAVAFVRALSADGHSAYLGPQRIADTVFPIGFLGVLAFGAFFALHRWSLALALLAMLPPLGYFAFDMLENAAVAGLLRAGPDAITPGMVARASFCTIWKYRLVDAALVVLALGWLARAFAWVQGWGRR